MAFLLTHLLDRATSCHPAAVAVRQEEGETTYAELQQRANSVARFLMRNEITVGDRVAMLAPKGADAIACIFGIMKAGAAYVPIDPAGPADRWRHIIADCGCRCIVVSIDHLEELSRGVAFASQDCELIIGIGCPETRPATIGSATLYSWEEVVGTDGTPSTQRVTENDLAYILYTSGSTGRPKGVMISHRSSLTFIEWAIEKFGVAQSDRIASNAPLHFDLSIFEVYCTLSAGGTIIIVPDDASRFPSQFVDLLARECVTVLYLVPSMLIRLVLYGQLDRADLNHVRCVLFAGEVFPLKYLRSLTKLLPHPRYFNLYGPTETNVCTYYEVTADDVSEDRVQPVPIGVPCDNTEVFAVNDAGSRVTIHGEVGELYVRGPSVAHGYWNDPERTRSAFDSNPFNRDYNDRVYKTGDLVRLAQDGKNWLFGGRRDQMVKANGYRVEMGEVETCLQEHSQIERAVVIAEHDELAGARLRAFATLKSGARQVTRGELRKHCAKYLPHYMIPCTIEIRDNLPLTSSGKLDRQKLSESMWCGNTHGDQ